MTMTNKYLTISNRLKAPCSKTLTRNQLLTTCVERLAVLSQHNMYNEQSAHRLQALSTSAAFSF